MDLYYSGENCSIIGFTIQDSEYGGIYISSKVNIMNNIIKNNGTGISSSCFDDDSNSVPKVSNNIILGNERGVWTAGAFIFENNVIEDNDKGVYLCNGMNKEDGKDYLNQAMIKNNTFINNYSAVYSDQVSPTVKNNIFKNNNTGILLASNFWSGGAGLPVVGNIISSNEYGISVFSSTGDDSFTNVILLGNNTIVKNGVAGLRVVNSIAVVGNTIFWDNGTDIIEESSVNSSIGYSCGTNFPTSWLDQGGNISTNPMFVNFNNDDFHLSPNSPCVDSGDTNPVFDDIEDPDNPGFALYPSLGTLRSDMGAYGGHGFSDYDYTWVGIDESESLIKNYTLNQNYPNPFNPTTTISFHNNERGSFELNIYNSKGEFISNLLNEKNLARIFHETLKFL